MTPPEHTAYRVPGSMSVYELAARLAHTAHFWRGGCYNWFAGEGSPEADEYARVLRECLPALLTAEGAYWLPAAALAAPADGEIITADAFAAPAAAPDIGVGVEESSMEEGDDSACDDYFDDDECGGYAFAPLT